MVTRFGKILGMVVLAAITVLGMCGCSSAPSSSGELASANAGDASASVAASVAASSKSESFSDSSSSSAPTPSGSASDVSSSASASSSAGSASATASNGSNASAVQSRANASLSELYADEKLLARQALCRRLYGLSDVLYVYRDYSDCENHFTQKMKMFGENPETPQDMQENWTDNPYSGTSCIRCGQETGYRDWGGWLFLNGYIPEGASDPVNNDAHAGVQGSQGLDLTGATRLSFWARGEEGGEVVDFFTSGYETDTSFMSNKRDLFGVKLSKEWEEYSIPLEGLDLSNIAGGFGYAVDNQENPAQSIVFYLDDIRFEGNIAHQQQAPMMIRSYDTTTIQTRNAAFTYDNALAAMAFISEDLFEEAEQVLDAFVYAVEHDRYQAGQIRNAYAAGDIVPFSGWGDNAKLPGWYDADAHAWYEDSYQVGSNVGNTSYAALALMHFAAEQAKYDEERAERYFKTAQTLMDGVIERCSDSGVGFTAGYEGWPENGSATTFTYKSTEHNIDAYAAFKQLYAVTSEDRYLKAAQSAQAFVESMYDKDRGVFYAGTTSDGVTPETQNIVLDAQVWAALSLGDEFAPYEAALDQLASMRTSEGGYRFHASDDDGYWCEGTAFTALMYELRGEHKEAAQALEVLKKTQLEEGLFPAASVDDLATGIYLSDGTPWLYGKDPHVAPTAWFVMACNGYNPYAFS